VLGVAGLVGAGRSEIAAAIFGLHRAASGQVFVNGALAAIDAPSDAIELGIGLVPEDRKRQGLVLSQSGLHNLSLPVLSRLSRMSWIDRRRERAVAAEFFERLRVRAPSLDSVVAELSGGNQQKIVLARWLAAKSRVLILDEPTRGVDVGAKAEIHALISELALRGNAIVLISSELPELVGLSSRIVVVREGRVVSELSREAATQDRLLRLMAGLGEGPSDAVSATP
jgi:ABC-type sugar transport system ATPase subunit